MLALSVLIADDHAVVRRGMRALLESEQNFTVVGEAADGREVLGLVERLKPDVLILDLMMPGLGGLEVLKLLAGRHLPTRVVVFSMHASEEYVAEAFRNGAIGYVVKDASAAELLKAVRCAADGHRFLSAPLSESAIDAYARRTRTESSDAHTTLTERERQVLHLAARGHTNQQIAAELQISRRTAETHRANLMRKLGLKGQQELLRYALRQRILDL